MKTGRNIIDMATEIQRQMDTKKDYIAPRGRMAMEVIDTPAIEDNQSTAEPVLTFPTNGHINSLSITRAAHQQIATNADIPQAYYNRMLASQPALLAHNVNTWFHADPQPRNMIRTMDGKVRAMLSDKYHRIDNYDVMAAVLPEIVGVNGINIMSAELTDTKMYIKVVNQRIEAEVSKGDIVQAGFVISNSEIGMGNVSVMPFVNRLVCINGMIVPEYAQKRRHVGRRIEETEDLSLYSEETINLDNQAFFAKIRDTIKATLTEAKFAIIVNKFKEAQGITIHQPEEVVEVTATRFNLTQGEQKSIFEHLLKGNNMTLWGLANAVTRTAEDSESYDRASELEMIGSRVLNLDPVTVSSKDLALTAKR